MDVQLDVVSAFDRAAKLVHYGVVAIIVASVCIFVFLEFQYLGHICHDGQFGPIFITETKQPLSGFDHQVLGTAIPIAVDFVVEGEDDSSIEVFHLSERLYLLDLSKRHSADSTLNKWCIGKQAVIQRIIGIASCTVIISAVMRKLG